MTHLRLLQIARRGGRALAVGLLVSAAPAVLAAGGNATAMLQVSASVMPYARVELHSAPNTVDVTAGDVDRGFVDVDKPMSFSVTTNMLHGPMVAFMPTGGMVAHAVVTGLSNPLRLDRDGGMVPLPAGGSGMRRTELTLRFRLFLSGATTPGTYPWPIRVSTEVL